MLTEKMTWAGGGRVLWCVVVGLVSLWIGGCDDEVTGPAAAIDPAPTTTTQPIEPGIVCVDQKETGVIIHGQNFSPVPIDVPKNPRTALPTVTLTMSNQLDGAAVTTPFSYTYNGDPDNPENVDLLSWQSQTQMTFQVRPQCADNSDCPDGMTCRTTNPKPDSPNAFVSVCVKSDTENVTGALPEGVFNVSVTNPNKSAAESMGAFAVIKQPTLGGISPSVLCLAQGERTLAFTGTRFLSVNEARVEAEIASATAQFPMQADAFEGCLQIPQAGYTTLEYCTGMSATLTQDSVQVGYQEVTIHNPETAACASEEDIMLRVVPPPVITAIREVAEDATSVAVGDGTIICLSEGDRQIVLHGQDFLEITQAGGTLTFPTVTVDGTEVEVNSLGGTCEDIEAQGFTVRKCDQVTVTVPASMNVTDAPKQVAVSITNPEPAGCQDNTDTRLNLLTLTPPPDLTDIEPALVCLDDGSRDIVLTGTNFLTIDGTKASVTFDGTAIDAANITTSNCEAVDVGGHTVERCATFTINLAQGSVPPGQPEVVVTNPPPANCSDTTNGLLTIPPSLSIASVDPASVCVNDAGVTPLTISGTGFLTVDGTQFALTINGQAVTPDSVADCTDLNVDGQTVQACNTITATFDATGLPVGDVPISITNPPPSDCALTADSSFVIAAPPTVTSINPTEICSDVPETFTMFGTNFTSATSITITSPSGTFVADTVTFVSDTELTVAFATGVPADTYDITASNGTTCTSTLPAALTVNPTPLVFFVDPPVVFNGIATEVTIFTTGLDETAQSVQLIAPDNSTIDLPGFLSPVRPNRILATIPSGLAAGDYRVSVTSADDCTSVITAPLTITDTLTLAVDLVDPPFASPTVATAVTISALDPAPGGQVQFTSTPRVYLNPNTGGGNAAQAMRAVVFQDATSLSAVVPPGVAPGVYDVIVVNPGGEVGIIDQGVTVTTAEPPLVTSIVPGSLVSSASTPNVTILGENLDLSGIQVSFDCLLPGGNTTTVDATAETVLDGQTATATVPAIGTAGAVCVVRVSNSDGSYFDFSAVSTTNSSRNLNPWAETEDMTEARRALSLEAGRPTATSRFLYAIGGDDGTAAGAKTSVESTNVSIFGDLSPWEIQRYSLPSPRTLASSAIIGRFIYVVGGNDGTAATDEVLRAEILNPLVAPEVIDLDAQLGDATAPGILQGLWHYRVAALFPSTDPSNPDGESLPGEVQSVELPDLTDGVLLSLTWEAVPGASGYRLYRTPAADDSVDNLQLLVELPGGANTSFIDNGQSPTDPAVVPLPPGTLGQWHAVEALTSVRESAATVAARNPNDPDEWFIYAFGGEDAAGTALNTYEYASVTVDPTTGAQTISPWTQGTKNLGASGRSLAAAWVVDNADTSIIGASETYVFVGTGAGPTGNSISTILSGRLDTTSTNGDLISAAAGSLDAENDGPTIRACGYGDANGFLYYFGGYGTSPNPVSTDSSTEIIAGPNLDNSNSLAGGSVIVQRSYASTAQESAFFFIAGGETASGVPTVSVEKAVQ